MTIKVSSVTCRQMHQCSQRQRRGLANSRVELNSLCVGLDLNLLNGEILVHVRDVLDRFHQRLTSQHTWKDFHCSSAYQRLFHQHTSSQAEHAQQQGAGGSRKLSWERHIGLKSPKTTKRDAEGFQGAMSVQGVYPLPSTTGFGGAP